MVIYARKVDAQCLVHLTNTIAALAGRLRIAQRHFVNAKCTMAHRIIPNVPTDYDALKVNYVTIVWNHTCPSTYLQAV